MSCFTDYRIKCMFFVAFTVLLLYGVRTQIKPFFVEQGSEIVPVSSESLEKYLIMFDVGSSGTRIHVYLFSLNKSGSWILKGEHYDNVRKSLSNFRKIPHKAANIITGLLEEAKEIIPKEKWNTTMVALKATAGFRLMPIDVANSILVEVHKAFENSTFSCAKECISIISGEDEGIYGWYTLNFLLDKIGKVKESVALLAVGGRSLQISFSPSKPKKDEEYTFLPQVHSEAIPIYSRSFLGLGTMSAKLSILKIPSNASDLFKRRRNPKNGIELSSPCVHPLVKITWKYNLERYQIIGNRLGQYGYKYCYKEAVDFLGNTVKVPEELRNQEIYAVSAHFINVIASTLLVYEPSGSFTVEKFISSCKSLCELTLKTFACLQCCYVAAVLQHSLGFSSEKEIKFATHIGGVSTSWSLGAALSML